jgi:hypothetical protein
MDRKGYNIRSPPDNMRVSNSTAQSPHVSRIPANFSLVLPFIKTDFCRWISTIELLLQRPPHTTKASCSDCTPNCKCSCWLSPRLPDFKDHDALYSAAAAATVLGWRIPGESMQRPCGRDEEEVLQGAVVGVPLVVGLQDRCQRVTWAKGKGIHYFGALD